MVGFFNIYKKSGVSSAKCVAVIKKKLGIKKCGHMGTLDPLAEGVLIVAVGKAAKLFDIMSSKLKTYVGEITFGIETDSLDITGRVLSQDGKTVTMEQVSAAVKNFEGEIMQVPPKYSAKSVGGVRGYDLARRGVDFELAPKKVYIKNIRVIKQTGRNKFEIEITCGGGTYIRSLFRDIASSLSTVAVMSALERTKSGSFCAEDAIYAEDAEIQNLIPPDKAVDLPEIETEFVKEILNGMHVKCVCADGEYLIYGNQQFLGIGRAQAGYLKLTVNLYEE